MFNAIECGDFNIGSYRDTIRIGSLGVVEIDKSDRNRTASVVYTGNKFEFRMLGSFKSDADINIVINTAMASSLRDMSDRLIGLNGDDLTSKLYKIVS